MKRGALQGLLAALLFGLSAPVAKLLLSDVRPLPLAALLYLGGGLGLTAWRSLRAVRSSRATVARSPSPVAREAPLRRTDLPWLLGVVVLGGAVGPLLMLWGLERVSGLAGSLLLNLEGPFTVLLAVIVFREHLGRRSLVGAALIFASAAGLSVQGESLGGTLVGAVAIAGACLAWALDNNFTQRVSIKDPFAVVQIKTLGAGAAMLLVALVAGDGLPPVRITLAALGLGALSYGASILLDALALRALGAAREAALFATAPFIGAVVSIPLLGDRPSLVHLGAAIGMALGVGQVLRDRHAHEHTHEPITHEHLHVHDEHHAHTHEGPVTEPHSHPHTHAPLTHAHAHVSDQHHRHRH